MGTVRVGLVNHEAQTREGRLGLVNHEAQTCEGRRGLVVLGCRTSARRSEVAANTFHAHAKNGGGFSCVVLSGGRAWAPRGGNPVVEADALARDLVALGVPLELVVRERCSHSTRENAYYAARILTRRGIRKITIVTSDWHVARASRHFEREGLEVEAAPVSTSLPTFFSRMYVRGHERVATLLDCVVR